MDYTLTLGLVAGMLTTFGFLPQLIKAVRTKSTRDLSEFWLIIMAVGLVFWLVYGYLIYSLPLIVFNFLSLTFEMPVLALKLKYK